MSETKDKKKKLKIGMTPLQLGSRLRIESKSELMGNPVSHLKNILPQKLFDDDKSDRTTDTSENDFLDEESVEKDYDSQKYFPKVVKRISIGPDFKNASKKKYNSKNSPKRSSSERIAIRTKDAAFESPSPTRICGWKGPPANYQPWTPGSLRKTYSYGMVSRETPPIKCLSPRKKKISSKLRFEGKQIFFQSDKNYSTNMKDYSVLELIGSGSSFNVYKVRYSKTVKLFALKKSQTKITTDGRLNHFKREVWVATQIGIHPRVLPIYAAWMENSDVFYLTPLHHFTLKDWPGGQTIEIDQIELRHLERGVWKMLLDISGALKHIASKGFVHVDVKPANILVHRKSPFLPEKTRKRKFETDRFVLTDLGQARRTAKRPGDPANPKDLGEWRYRPPEILARTSSLHHDGEVVERVKADYDVYSLGMVALDILLGTILPLQALEKIWNGSPREFLRETQWSEPLVALVARMLSRNSEERPPAAEVYSECSKILSSKC